MKKIALTILSLLTLQAFSQTQITYMWTGPVQSSGNDATRSVGYDGAWNTYDAGYFRGTVDFDRTIAGTYNQTSAGGSDIYIRKNTQFGFHAWTITLGGTQDDVCWDIQVKSDGDVVATGYFTGIVDFDPGSGITNLNGGSAGAVFIARYSSTGNLVWAKQLSAGSALNEGKTITRDAAGNIITAGVMRDNMDCDPGPGVTTLNLGGGLNQAFVVKLDSSGNFVWGKGFTGAGTSVANSVAVNTAGDVYFTGAFVGTVDVNGDATTDDRTSIGSGTSDIFVEKILENGTFSWCVVAGITQDDIGYGISVNSSDEIFVTGGFRGVVDFDPGPGTANATAANNTTDVFYWRLTNAGAFVYIFAFSGGTGNDVGYDIHALGSTVTICGTFYGSIDFNPGPTTTLLTSTGQRDAFVVRLSNYSTYLYCGLISGSADEIATAVVQGPSNNVYIGGEYTSSNVDFKPGSGSINIPAVGGTDGFLSRWNHCTSAANPTSVISGPSQVCAGSTPTYSVTLTQGVTYSWGLPATWSGVNGTNVITPTAGTGGGTITVTAFNECGSSPPQARSVSVVNGTPAAPSAISGPTTPCEGSTQTYSVTAVAGVTYTWTLPGGWTGSSTTNSISVVVGNTSGTITVTANNICGSSTPASLSVNPNLLPAAPATVSGNTSVCSGSTVTYTASNVPNATSYNWSLPVGWSGSSSTASITATAGSTSGVITVNGINACGNGPSTTLSVSTITAPTAPDSVSGPTSLCENANYTYTVNFDSNATSYNWTLPATWGSSSTGNSISGIAGNSGGSISVTATNSCGSSTPTTLSVTVTPLPQVQAITEDTVCSNLTATLSGTFNTGTVSWYTSPTSGTPIHIGSTFITGPLTTTTTYFIQAESNGCYSSFDPVTAYVIEIDTGVSLSVNTLIADHIGADTYQWIDCNNGNQPIAGATNQSFTLSMNGTYAVIVSQNGCVDTSNCITTTVNLNEIRNAVPISIAPNPATDHVIISGVQQVRLIEVYDLSGRLLITDQNVNSISVATLPAALYHIRITTASGVSNLRLQKM